MNNYFVQTYTWNPWRNLAVEKYLADKIEPGDVVLYLWQNGSYWPQPERHP